MVMEFQYFHCGGLGMSHAPCYVAFMQDINSKFRTNMAAIR